MIVGGTHALLPGGTRREMVFELDEFGVIRKIRPWALSDPDLFEGMVVPALVNAHTHLELSALKGKVPGGEGLVRWVGSLLRERLLAEPGGATDAAADLVRLGVGVVCDISNSGDTVPALQSARLSGLVQRELLTLDAGLLQVRIREACEPDATFAEEGQKILLRPSPHALYSTAPALVKASVYGREERDVARPPASIHLAEDAEEIRFLRDGTGAWASFLDRAGIDWRWWTAPGGSPVELLSELGVLGPDLLLVHGVHLTPQDRALIARSGATVVLCPRSNRHIHGNLPEAAALVDNGVHIALGTDSLASSPDLDVLGEIPVLGAAFPSVDPLVWLRAATEGGAQALRFGAGRLEVGTSPGLLLLENVERAEQLVDRAPARRWLMRPRYA